MPHKNKIFAILLLTAGGVAAGSPDATNDRKPPPDSAVPPALIELRARLLGTPRDQARSDPARFRALCDSDGYPLVGNIAQKSGRYQPSELCADVRKTARK